MAYIKGISISKKTIGGFSSKKKVFGPHFLKRKQIYADNKKLRSLFESAEACIGKDGGTPIYRTRDLGKNGDRIQLLWESTKGGDGSHHPCLQGDYAKALISLVELHENEEPVDGIVNFINENFKDGKMFLSVNVIAGKYNGDVTHHKRRIIEWVTENANLKIEINGKDEKNDRRNGRQNIF